MLTDGKGCYASSEKISTLALGEVVFFLRQTLDHPPHFILWCITMQKKKETVRFVFPVFLSSSLIPQRTKKHVSNLHLPMKSLPLSQVLSVSIARSVFVYTIRFTHCIPNTSRKGMPLDPGSTLTSAGRCPFSINLRVAERRFL